MTIIIVIICDTYCFSCNSNCCASASSCALNAVPNCVAFRPYLNGCIFSLQRAITDAGSISDFAVYRSETSLYTDKTTKSSTINANSTKEYSAASQLIIRLYTYKNVNILYFTTVNRLQVPREYEVQYGRRECNDLFFSAGIIEASKRDIANFEFAKQSDTPRCRYRRASEHV